MIFSLSTTFIMPFIEKYKLWLLMNQNLFYRMTKKSVMSSVQSLVAESVDSACPLQNSSGTRAMLQRSPSLPTIREDFHQLDRVDRKHFSFASPHNEGPAKEALRRSPSMPIVPKANQLKHCQDSPLAQLAHLASKRATTPSSVPHTVVYSSVGATPMQRETPSINRAPLQCITPLNQRELIFSNVMQPVWEL